MISFSALLTTLLLILAPLSILRAESPAPFRAAEGLFEKGNLKTLGLQTIPGQHTMLPSSQPCRLPRADVLHVVQRSRQ